MWNILINLIVIKIQKNYWQVERVDVRVQRMNGVWKLIRNVWFIYKNRGLLYNYDNKLNTD